MTKLNNLFSNLSRSVIIALIISAFIVGAGYAVFGTGGGRRVMTSGNINKGLIGHWPLDGVHYNSSTNRVDDITPYSNHGTNYGASLTTNRFNQSEGAMSFNGNDYVKIEDTIIDNPTSLTISSWIRKGGEGGTYECALHQASDTKIGSSSYWLGVEHSTNYITATIGANTGVGWSAGRTSIEAIEGEWNHVLATWDGDWVKVYVNGEYIKEYELNSYSTLTTPTRFGASSDGTTYQFNGQINDVRIYNRALSTSEVQTLYSVYNPKITLGQAHKGLIGHWPLDKSYYNSSTNRVDDVSPYSNHGTNYGATLIADRFNQSEKAMSFSTNDESLLLDYTVWKDGQTGSVGIFNTYSTGNSRILAEDPWGRKVPVWKSVPNAGIYCNAQAIDNTKLYRMSWWEKRVTNADATYARYYAGLNGYGSTNGVLRRDSGSNSTNPYFWNTSNIPTSAQLPEEEWILVVGHVWPAGSGTGSNHSDSGRYTLDGFLGSIGVDYVWREETTTARSRTLTVYQGNDPEVLHYTVYPRVDIVDGTEPSIQDLLDGHDKYGDDIEIELSGTKESFSFWYDQDSNNQWQHIVKSGTDLYVNAELNTPAEYPLYISGDEVYIGRSASSDFIDGTIDEVRIYDRTLSMEEIVQLYDSYQPKLVSGSLYKGLVLDMPLTSKYTKNDTVGSEILADRTPYANHGQNSGAIIGEQSAEFDGSSSGITIDNFPLIFANSISLSAWVYYNDDSRGILFGNYSSFNNINFEKHIDKRLRLYWNRGERDVYSNINALTLNEWNHVVIIRNNELDRFEFYVNGNLDRTVSNAGSDVTDTSQTFRIGKDSRTGTTVTNGQISNVRIYNRALSVEEITQLYNLGL